MRHILLIHQAFVSPKQAGGTRHYEFARLLAPDGQYRFTIIASTLSYLTGQQSQPSDDSDLERNIVVIRAYTLPVSHRSFVWRVIAFFSFMVTAVWSSRRAKQIDVVMGTTPPIFQSVSAWFIAFVRRKPFLLEVRDLWPEFAIDMGVLKNPILIRLSRLLENFLYRRADHILVNSPAYYDYMLTRGIAKSKVTLIPNGVDAGVFNLDSDGQAVREWLGLGQKFIVIYAGALGMANDIDVILKAANHLCEHQDIHFLLVGDGKERSNLEAKAKQQNLKNVTFTGALPKNEMPVVLAASNICTATLLNIPMFRTTYPNKVFDYMAASRPVILAIDGVIRDVVESSKGGIFVEPGNDRALADAIMALYNDPAKVKEMGQNGRDYVMRNFNRQTHAKEFALLIDKIIKRI
ncbi:MAG: glycosyltransferase WbuB [Chloroflexi bacterium]|nr:glycosyltransferase WbuB [Chloroflexota bacterium]